MDRNSNISRRFDATAIERKTLNGEEEPQVQSVALFWTDHLDKISTSSSSSASPRNKRQKLYDLDFEAISIYTFNATLRFAEDLPSWTEGEARRWQGIEATFLWSVEHADDSENSSITRFQITTGSDRPVFTCHTIEAGDSLFYKKINLASAIASMQLRREAVSSPGHLHASVNISLTKAADMAVLLQLEYEVFWNSTPSLSYMSINPYVSDALHAYFPTLADKKASTAQDFFTSAHISPSSQNDEPISITGLLTSLMPFQKSTVAWLLYREATANAQSMDGSNGKAEISQSPQNDNDSKQLLLTSLVSTEVAIPWSFRAVQDTHGRTAFVSDVLGLITRNTMAFRQVDELKGGILAEEMGLGKTLEIVALILSHRRSLEMSKGTVIDLYTGKAVRPIGTTLIISPPSILDQWLCELARHAPQLKVMHYLGISKYRKLGQNEILDMLGSHDVVLATYNVLSKELHWAQPPPDRSSRRTKVSRVMSPLVLCSWWRICLDEAQMLESGVNAAARVARLIPRINSWAVTGTPVRKDIGDLLGFLTFLRLEPFATLRIYWDRLITHSECFRKLFNQLSIRHTKLHVRDQLKLPGQHRFVISLPFTPIEEECYQTLVRTTIERVKAAFRQVSLPFRETDSVNAPFEIMRVYLASLRQCALHPEIKFGRKKGPLRTVDEVLDAMLEESILSISTSQRERLYCKLRRGQYYENSPRLQEARQIWVETVKDVQVLVDEARKMLCILLDEQQLQTAKPTTKHVVSGAVVVNSSDHSEDEIPDGSSLELQRQVGSQRTKLRLLLELKHVAVYYLANLFHQLASRKWLTELSSEEIKGYEECETKGYDLAQEIRQEILKEISDKTNNLITRVTTVAHSALVDPQLLRVLPTDTVIEGRSDLDKYNLLIDAMNRQTEQYKAWRNELLPLLTSSLLDQKTDVDISGDEYVDSMKTQDDIMVILNFLRIVVEDRHEILTGVVNELKRFETKTALKLAMEGSGPNPKLFIKMCQLRDSTKPVESLVSIRSIVADFRALIQALQADVAYGGISCARAQNQLAIVLPLQKEIHATLSSQSRTIDKLRQENNLFTHLMNSRIEYFRELQVLSDQVGEPLADEINQRNWQKHDRLKEREVALDRLIDVDMGRRRYLLNLKNSSLDSGGIEAYRKCVICQDEIEIGTLTTCGHQFCRGCMHIWWTAHKRCPTCNKYLTYSELHDISYRPQVLKVIEQSNPIVEKDGSSNSSTIYSEISKDTLESIQSIQLPGPSYTTKVNVISRHILYLREKDPGAKSIIFSQFKDFLEVLSHAFQAHRIGFASISQAKGIDKFKTDSSIEVFLLHGKAQSSGLNLINASHVFLCEPLINTALELQAIARVDRIGQRAKTNVYLYLIENTVEEAIYQISVKRRVAYFGKKENTKEITSGICKGNDVEDDIELANSLEMQKAPINAGLTKGMNGGELVPKEDLWKCLFGNATIGEDLEEGDN